MEKQVSFHIKIESDGAEVIHKVTAEAGELAKVINDVTEAQTELNSQMINLDQFVESWKNFYDGFQEAEAIMSDLSDAYNTQMTAEVTLDTIMKQRMDATDGMVESIKNLCSEQQKLGVQCGCNPQSAMSVMMITAYIFEPMSLRFEGAMEFHCNR